MRCAVLAGLFLGQLAVRPHAIALKSMAGGRLRPALGLDADWMAAESAIGEGQGLMDNILDVDVDEDQDVGAFEMMDMDEDEAIEDAGAGEDAGETVTLSPEQRKAMHAAQYTKEFLMEINMKDARDMNKQLGIVVQAEEDWKPLKVLNVRKHGLVQEWNDAHPGQDIHVDDEILQVNHVQWHHNSTSFEERVRGQFLAGMKGKQDALVFHVVRPWQQSKKRFKEQREDAHFKKYGAEFTAEISVQGESHVVQTWNEHHPEFEMHVNDESLLVSDDAMAVEMGWILNFTHDWEPVKIGQIVPGGFLDKWNTEREARAFPRFPGAQDQILAGDEILGVNKVVWHHNSTIFLQRLWQQFALSRTREDLNGTLLLSVRRSRAAQNVFDDLNPVQKFNVKSFVSADLVFNEPDPTVETTGDLGWKLTQNLTTGHLSVRNIKEVGKIAEWNKAHPDKEIRIGDDLLSVGESSDGMFETRQDFLNKVREVAKAAARAGDAQPITLALKRTIRSSRRALIKGQSPQVDGDEDDESENPASEKEAQDESDDEGFVGAED